MLLLSSPPLLPASRRHSLFLSLTRTRFSASHLVSNPLNPRRPPAELNAKLFSLILFFNSLIPPRPLSFLFFLGGVFCSVSVSVSISLLHLAPPSSRLLARPSYRHAKHGSRRHGPHQAAVPSLAGRRHRGLHAALGPAPLPAARPPGHRLLQAVHLRPSTHLPAGPGRLQQHALSRGHRDRCALAVELQLAMPRLPQHGQHHAGHEDGRHRGLRQAAHPAAHRPAVHRRLPHLLGSGKPLPILELHEIITYAPVLAAA